MDRIARIAKRVFLATYLNPHQQKLLEEQLKQGRKEDYGPLFKDERTYFPMRGFDLPDIPAPDDIKQALSDLGYEITNYREGHAVKKGDRREFNIGKILQREVKDNSLLKEFQHRLGKTDKKSSNGDLVCVITHKPEDVAAMSTNRNWTSCMALPEKPGEAGGLHHGTALRQVSHGGMCAYLIDSEDREISRPYARIAIKRLEDERNGAFVYKQEPAIYGDKDFAKQVKFPELVERKLEESNRETVREGLVFRTADPDSYSDGRIHGLIEHGDFSDKRKETLMGLDFDEKKKIIEDGVLPEWIWEVFVKDPDDNIRECMAKNRKCPAKVLVELLEDNNKNIRRCAVQNPNCPIDVLKKLSRDRDEWTRESVARNQNCPAEILADLVRDLDRQVKRSALSNGNCPVEILEKLYGDNNSDIRLSVAENPNCPAKALVSLSKDNDKSVRESVVYNPNCPAEALINLLKLSNDGDRIRELVAENPNCPADALMSLSNDNDIGVKTYVAWNPNCPAEALVKLSKDNDKSVRESVVYNPNCPAEALRNLADDEDEDNIIRILAREHRNYRP